MNVVYYGIATIIGIILCSLVIYLIVRLGTAAYFQSLREHEVSLVRYLKKNFGFDRRKTSREVPREAEK